MLGLVVADSALDVSDVLGIHELLARYGHVIDERRWGELGEVFTDDATFDASDFGAPVVSSLDALRTMWSSDESQHPLAHHSTNVVISVGEDGVVRVASKGLGVLSNGRVGSVTYHDELRRVDGGWRLSRRVATLRRPPPA